MRRGLQLDRVVLLGRTFDEYARFFALDEATWRGRPVLDVASGVSSFRSEAVARGWSVTAVDPIYALEPEAIEPRCAGDLEHVTEAVRGLPTYKWEFYRTPEGMRAYRDRAWRTFLESYRRDRSGYVAASLPALPFDAGQFALTLVSYFLFAYQEHFDYAFHRDSIGELMRVTAGEARVYPLVTFEARPSDFLEPLRQDPALRHLDFEVVPTDFEFLVGSNAYLRITHRRVGG